jgi:hypothetical protein
MRPTERSIYGQRNCLVVPAALALRAGMDVVSRSCIGGNVVLLATTLGEGTIWAEDGVGTIVPVVLDNWFAKGLGYGDPRRHPALKELFNGLLQIRNPLLYGV